MSEASLVKSPEAVWQTNGTDHDDVWDDTVLINAYNRAIRSVNMELNITDEGQKSANSTHPKRGGIKHKKRKRKQKLWKVGASPQLGSVTSISPSGGTGSPSGKLLRLDDANHDEHHIVADVADNEFIEEDMDGCPNDLSDDNSYQGKWTCSDICYAPDVQGCYMLAVINRIVNKIFCKVTFVSSGHQKQTRIEYLKKRVRHPMPESYQDSFSPTGSITPQLDDIIVKHSSSSFLHHQPPTMLPNKLLNAGMPPPLMPPPPLLPHDTSIMGASDDGLSGVLHSWYQSGYRTGYYQASQKLKQRAHTCTVADTGCATAAGTRSNCK